MMKRLKVQQMKMVGNQAYGIPFLTLEMVYRPLVILLTYTYFLIYSN